MLLHLKPLKRSTSHSQDPSNFTDQPFGSAEFREAETEGLKHQWLAGESIRKTSINAMELADKAVGFLLTIISLSIFSYYTFWVIILPFVESDHFIHLYFLPREYAIIIPLFAGITLLSFLSVFIGYVLLKSKKKTA
ncbi:hypothetical protein KFK09_002919 [Dendrobium nobile]|uniref:Dolichol phosphate-mannose biosynthesis regulatory protein n=1 Tax=Dendrobium nobile TaxID=94219 RepID=A0A8T3C7N5_DENNO|nr:hypothetical protein KFK09_002919 [Dendrobium nobile]